MLQLINLKLNGYHFVAPAKVEHHTSSYYKTTTIILSHGGQLGLKKSAI